MPVSSVVTDREYREACGRLRGIINAASRHDLTGSRPERPVLVARIVGEIQQTIRDRELRKDAGPRLQAYAEGLLAYMEQAHTERRCWHVDSGTWRPDAEGKSYKLGRMPADAGAYNADLTVTFWRPVNAETSLRVYTGAVPEDMGTRYSAYAAPEAVAVVAATQRPSEAFVALPASVLAEARPRGVGLILSLPGRHGAGQTEALFSKSGLIRPGKLDHHAFVVFEFDPNLPGLHVKIVRTVSDVLAHADDTPVMLQWPGAKRSDYFHFTVGDLRDFLNRYQEATGSSAI